MILIVSKSLSNTSQRPQNDRSRRREGGNDKLLTIYTLTNFIQINKLNKISHVNEQIHGVWTKKQRIFSPPSECSTIHHDKCSWSNSQRLINFWWLKLNVNFFSLNVTYKPHKYLSIQTPCYTSKVDGSISGKKILHKETKDHRRIRIYYTPNYGKHIHQK